MIDQKTPANLYLAISNAKKKPPPPAEQTTAILSTTIFRETSKK